MAGTFRGHTFNALMQPNAVDDRPLAFRSTLAPFGTYANPDGSESFGFAWPAAVTEPINALQRLAQNSYTEDGRLGIPNPQHPENLQDASTLLWSIYGGNALNPAAVVKGGLGSGVKSAVAGAEAKGARPEPSAWNPKAEAMGGDSIAEIAKPTVPHPLKYYKPEFDDYGGVTSSLSWELQDYLRKHGIDSEFGASNQSISRYLSLGDNDTGDVFKLRLSDHADRHGSDATVRVDGNIDDIYKSYEDGSTIGRREYADLSRDRMDNYDWRGATIDEGDYRALLRESLGHVNNHLTAAGKNALPILFSDTGKPSLFGSAISSVGHDVSGGGAVTKPDWLEEFLRRQY